MYHYVYERRFMAKHKVEINNINTSSLKVLSSEETLDLFNKMHEGDIFARDELVKGNLTLVLSILKKFQNKVDNLDDLFQVGCLGLVKAIDNFDTSYDVKLSTYACPMILGEIKRYLRDNSFLRVSRQLKDRAYQAMKVKEEYIAKYQKEPSNEEIARILNLTSFEVIEALEAINNVSSLSEPLYNDFDEMSIIIFKNA